MHNAQDNNWFKLFALMAVAGVAKSLFGPPPAPRPVINQTISAVKDELESRRDSE